MGDAPGRPATGPGHYLRDLVYGALDGVVTTMAVLSGVAGADLGARVALILGLANLVADGLSMGASNYLGLKSELHQTGRSVAEEEPWRHGLATFAAFFVAGGLPLAAVVIVPGGYLPLAGALAAVTLFAVGAARARFLPQGALRAGLEMLVVGAVAAAAAYGIGVLADRFI